MAILYVIIGGSVGALSRFGLGKIFPFLFLGIQFSTLVVNLIGCFIAGLSLHYFQGQEAKAFWLIGFCGALTTFSAYIIEMADLIEHKAFTTVLVLWILHHSLSFLVFYIGYKKLPLLLGN
jgi:CrcB protein